nr:MAG TPA: hypothetical protein [Caudoviricetes sp.]
MAIHKVLPLRPFATRLQPKPGFVRISHRARPSVLPSSSSTLKASSMLASIFALIVASPISANLPCTV